MGKVCVQGGPEWPPESSPRQTNVCRGSQRRNCCAPERAREIFRKCSGAASGALSFSRCGPTAAELPWAESSGHSGPEVAEVFEANAVANAETSGHRAGGRRFPAMDGHRRHRWDKPMGSFFGYCRRACQSHSHALSGRHGPGQLPPDFFVLLPDVNPNKMLD
jgi:hypothetical protein